MSISVKVCLCDSSLGHVSSFISIRRCHDWAGGTRTTAADTALEKTGVRASLPVSSACKNHLSRPTSAAKPAQAAAHGAGGLEVYPEAEPSMCCDARHPPDDWRADQAVVIEYRCVYPWAGMLSLATICAATPSADVPALDKLQPRRI